MVVGGAELHVLACQTNASEMLWECAAAAKMISLGVWGTLCCTESIIGDCREC